MGRIFVEQLLALPGSANEEDVEEEEEEEEKEEEDEKKKKEDLPIDENASSSRQDATPWSATKEPQ